MLYGPMQLIVMTFPTADFPTDLSDQLRVVRETGFVRLLDVAYVSKNDQSDLLVLEGTDLEQEEEEFLGIMEGAFFGYGAAGDAGVEAGMEEGLVASENGVFGLSEDDLLEIADRIPIGSSALFLLIEHLWALGLKDAAESSQGTVVANGFITPETLVRMGANATKAG
jgi:uncharacterized membrane protein